jgi:hypothetical protein
VLPRVSHGIQVQPLAPLYSTGQETCHGSPQGLLVGGDGSAQVSKKETVSHPANSASISMEFYQQEKIETIR